MSTRWWAPEGERSVDTLLRPGDDPKMDLGLALLGLHRAGAEACELVARTALADEETLIAALAETRALLAPQAVGMIAKAVDGSTYAGLLLRDVLDDAENAALALYRSCLAKRVSPPVAAGRVGLVYGVPSRELTEYTRLATDTKTPPATLVDKADRVLFGFVQGLTAEEYVGAKETFAKAPTQDFTPDDPATPYYDARSHGRFARTATRTEVLPGVTLNDLLNPQPVTTGPEVGTATPERQGLRTVKRAKRVKRVKVLPKEQLKSGTLSAGKLGRGSLARRTLTRSQLAKQQLSSAPPPVKEVSTQLAVSGDMLARRRDDEPLRYTGLTDVGFVLTAEEFAQIVRASGDGGDGRIVLAGPLTDATPTGALLQLDSDSEVSSLWMGELDAAAQSLRERHGEHTAERLSPEVQADLDAAGPAFDARMEQVKLRWLSERLADLAKLDHRYSRINPRTELTNVAHYVDTQDLDNWILVWQEPDLDRPHQPRRIPHLVEFVAEDSVPGALNYHAGGEVTAELDPNQGLKFFPVNRKAFDPYDLPRVTYDYERGAVRELIYFHAVDDDEVQEAREHRPKRGLGPKGIGKADSPYLRAHHVTQSKTGEFVRAEVLPGVTLDDLLNAPAEEEPVQRVKRAKRVIRRTATPPAALSRGTLARGTLGQGQLGRDALGHGTLSRGQLALEPFRANPATHDLVMLDPDEFYFTPSAETMERMLVLDGQHGFPQDIDTPWELSARTRRILLESGSKKGMAAEVDLDHTVLSRHTRRVAEPSNEFPHEAFLGRRRIDNPEDIDDLAYGLADQDLLHVQISRDPQGVTWLTVHANGKPMPLEHVIADDASPDPDSIRTLLPGSVKRRHNAVTIGHWLNQLYLDVELVGSPIEDTLANPHVMTWTATTR